MIEIDLEERRCPNAQIVLNQLLKSFLASDINELVLTTIEPSLERSIIERIAHFDYPISIESSEARVLPELDSLIWRDEYDDEDYEGITHQRTFTLKKTS